MLKTGVARFPKSSGVYFMKDAKGRIIYVGKANNLRSRVRSYFRGALPARTTGVVRSGGDTKTQLMMQGVKSISFRRTPSDLDALLLEARLVRELKPKYNIQLTDDKSFPLLAVTREEFPRVFITRERGKKNIAYYGPFVSSADLRHAFRILQRLFRFRVCKHNIGNGRSCLLAHINLCLAPCLNKITPDGYRETIASLDDFLKGNKGSVNKRLERLMKDASARLDYEAAAFYRDRLKALDNISETGKLGPFYEESFLAETPRQKLRLLKEALSLASEPVRIEGIDISDIKGTQAVGSVVVFVDGEPARERYRRFRIKETAEGMADDYSRIREVVRRRFYGLSKENARVDLLLIDGGRGQVSAALGALEAIKITPPAIVGLAKGGGKRETVYLWKQGNISKLRMGNKLKLLAYARDEAHRFAQKYHHLIRSKEALK
ncbi:MAG: excinuclease ABC subunit UvrC [Planctomycetota bacterium]